MLSQCCCEHSTRSEIGHCLLVSNRSDRSVLSDVLSTQEGKLSNVYLSQATKSPVWTGMLMICANHEQGNVRFLSDRTKLSHHIHLFAPVRTIADDTQKDQSP